MIIKRQKEFGKMSGLKNKIKAVPRHLKRSINQGKAAGKIATYADELNPEEVKSLALTFRAAKTPGTKTSKKMVKLVKKGKATPEMIEKESEAWGRIHKNGKGAKYDFLSGGYVEPGNDYSSRLDRYWRQLHKEEKSINPFSNPKI